jgi:hypothetical protein
MVDERREDARDPDFVNVELVTTDPEGRERAYPIILRDRSGTGIGAMYVGKEVLSPKEDYVLRGGGDECAVRIVWTKQIADFVLMLGMELADAVSA